MYLYCKFLIVDYIAARWKKNFPFNEVNVPIELWTFFARRLRRKHYVFVVVENELFLVFSASLEISCSLLSQCLVFSNSIHAFSICIYIFSEGFLPFPREFVFFRFGLIGSLFYIVLFFSAPSGTCLSVSYECPTCSNGTHGLFGG